MSSERPRRDTASPRSGAAAALCWTGREEILQVQGQELQLRFAGPAERRYPSSKVRESPVGWQALEQI